MKRLLKVWRSKTGRRFSRDQYGTTEHDDVPPSIASFMTPSLREILKIFNKRIVFLRATGDRNIHKRDIGIPNLGLKLNLRSNNSCEIVYKNRYSDRNKHDDLSKRNVKRILNLLKKHGIPDCAVSEFIIQFESNKLKKDLGTKDNLFFAHFVLHQCENEDERNVWEEYDINYNYQPQGLLQQGFKHSVLHCIKLIDNHQLRTIPKSKRKYHIYWIEKNKDLEKNNIDYHSHPDIALEVKVKLPKYGKLKNYRRDTKWGLVLASIE